MTTNTPEKSTALDKCPCCGSEKSSGILASLPPKHPFACGSYLEYPKYQSDLCRALEAKQKAEVMLKTYKDHNEFMTENCKQFKAELAKQYRSNSRAYKSRERNIRRAWRMRKEVLLWQDVALTTQQELAEVTRQRDRLVTSIL